MSEIIGTSTQVITDYLGQAEAIFDRIRDRMQQLVTRAFSLTYEGPDAELEFNPGLVKLATTSVGEMDSAMTQFAHAVSQVTSNISQSLGASPVTLTYSPQATGAATAPRRHQRRLQDRRRRFRAVPERRPAGCPGGDRCADR